MTETQTQAAQAAQAAQATSGQVDDKAPVRVGDVEGHPIFFDPRSGGLYGEINGRRIEHRTYSTLRKLLYQAHLSDLSAVPVAYVRRSGRYYGRGYTTGRALVVGRATDFRDQTRLVTTDGTHLDDGSVVAIPEDSGEDLDAVRATLAGFSAEAEAEQKRHEAAEADIEARANAYVQALGERHPMAPLAARVAGLRRESDRLALRPSRS
jgi:hypothetical protein